MMHGVGSEALHLRAGLLAIERDHLLAGYVPNIAFDEVYQEIVAVYCGNYWGHSGADAVLDPLISTLSTDQLRRIIFIIQNNDRAKAELFQSKPKERALLLLETIKGKLTIAADLAEADQAIAAIQAL